MEPMERVLRESIEFFISPRKTNLKLDSQCTIQEVQFMLSISQSKLNNVDQISILAKCRRPFKDTGDSLNFYINFHTENDDEKFELSHSSKHKLMKGCVSGSFIIYIPHKTIFNYSSLKKFCRLDIEKVVGTDENVGELKLPKEGCTLKSSYLERLWNDKLFTDFLFKVNDREFPVHKSVLAAQNDVFKTMFNSEMQENITNTAVITDISPEAFKQFLEYLYIRKYPKYCNHTIDLYKTAHKYDVKDLLKYCQKIIQKNVNVKNAMDMLEFANIFDIEIVRKSAFSIIQKDLFPEKKLLPTLEHNPKIMREIINAKHSYELKFSTLTTLAKK